MISLVVHLDMFTSWLEAVSDWFIQALINLGLTRQLIKGFHAQHLNKNGCLLNDVFISI